MEAHVASVEPDDGVRLLGRVVHDHFCLLDGVSGGRGLFGAYVVERDKHRGVDGACDVEEVAGDTLHACDAAFIKGWCGQGVRAILHFGPGSWQEPLVRRVLGAHGRGLLKALRIFADIVGQGDVDIITGVVLFDCQAAAST